MKREAGMIAALLELADQREWQTGGPTTKCNEELSFLCKLDLSFFTSNLIAISGKTFSFR